MSLSSTLVPALPPLGTYELVATVIEAWLYGLNCVLYSAAVYIICHRRSGFKAILLFSSSFLITIATCHIWVDGVALYQAFVLAPALAVDMQTMMQATTLFFEDTSSPLALAGVVLYVLVAFAQDLMLLWRLHVVWQHWWPVVVGSITELGSIGCTTLALILISNPNNTYTALPVYPVVVTAYALHLFFNCTVTFLIVYKLWSMGRKLQSFFPGQGGYYARGIGIMVESGSIYTMATTITLGLFVARTQIADSLTNVLTQLATLTPLLIIVRVGFTLSPVSAASSSAAATIQTPPSVSHEAPVTQSIHTRQTKLQQRAQDQARAREVRIAIRREVEFTNVQAPSQEEVDRDSFDLEMEEMGKKKEGIMSAEDVA
ncbi:hypothetical protein CALVIDRAFT_563300 [Calocera viscosa TUFC12733]|uniref:Uncharacterized protein n=1 Tax=Calocera viscosa (strain TUFC12733) TaxID=1330018 RepID=A0A167MV00_CALVF|nr:hypothetical protein CALVIDRAFT_563300 [Calocera viscosa TUFC12733]